MNNFGKNFLSFCGCVSLKTEIKVDVIAEKNCYYTFLPQSIQGVVVHRSGPFSAGIILNVFHTIKQLNFK